MMIVGDLPTHASEMAMYSDLFDAKHISTGLDNLLIVPHRSIYVKGVSKGKPWESTTIETHLIRLADDAGDTTEKLDQTDFLTLSEPRSVTVALNAEDSLNITLTNATINLETLDKHVVVNKLYSNSNPPQTINFQGGVDIDFFENEPTVALVPTELAQNISNTKQQLTQHANEQLTLIHKNTSYQALSGSAQLQYTYDFIQAVIQAYVDIPLHITSDNEMSLIQYNPTHNAGLGVGIGFGEQGLAQLTISTGLDFFVGEVSSSLPRKVNDNALLQPISFTDDDGNIVSLVDFAYQELTSERVSDSHFYIALDLSSASKHQLTTSASIRYAFQKEPDAPNFKNLSFEETTLTVSMNYSL
jgi:hypothetical protein